MTTPSFLILVAGPYRTGTSDDPALIAANLRAIKEACLHLFRAGHIPAPGEALSLPLAEIAGSRQRGDTFHPVGRPSLPAVTPVSELTAPLRVLMKWSPLRKTITGWSFLDVKMSLAWKTRGHNHSRGEGHALDNYLPFLSTGRRNP